MSSKVAVIGAGTIGRSFAYLFARSGGSVRVFDPREDLAEVVADLQAAVTADASARDQVASQIGTVAESETVEAAVDGTSFVQESGPEDAGAKPELFARIAEAADAEAVLATSSSTFPASSIAEHLDAEAAARVLVGHPFNPPHLMQLIDAVPPPWATAAARAAAAEGQFEGLHFGGGEAGVRGFMDHIGPAFAAIEDLPVDVDPAAMEEVFEQVEQAYGQSPTAEAAATRDRIQRAVLDARGQDH